MVISRCQTFNFIGMYDLFFDNLSISNSYYPINRMDYDTKMRMWSINELQRIIL